MAVTAGIGGYRGPNSVGPIKGSNPAPGVGVSGGTSAFYWHAPEGLVNGGRLMISSNGAVDFGIRSSQSPILYDDFNGTDGQALSAYNPAWVNYGAVSGLVSAAQARYPGAKSAYNGNTRSADSGFYTNYRSFPDLQKLRVSYWAKGVMPASGGTDGQIKLARVGSAEYGRYNAPEIFSFSSWHPTTGQDSSQMRVNKDADPQGELLGYVGHPRNQWFKVDMLLEHSTVGVADGTVYVTVNNGQSSTGRFGTVMTRDTGYDKLANSILLGIMTANAEADFPIDVYNGSMHIDSGWDRIVLCNAATIVPGTIVEDQNYVLWKANQINFTFNKGAISGPCWLKYMNGLTEVASAYLGTV
jgi:hypothetical protein